MVLVPSEGGGGMGAVQEFVQPGKSERKGGIARYFFLFLGVAGGSAETVSQSWSVESMTSSE